MWQHGRVRIGSIGLVMCALNWLCCWALGDSLALRNYAHDPNLAKAMGYDIAENRGDYEKADRAKAERYYLAYLKDVNESFQKARVYDHLGALYASSAIGKGEKADYDKARYYFRKVLELEPERIDWPTIRARTMLAGMAGSSGGRIEGRMAAYKWLVGIDEEEIRRCWLPLSPDNTSPSDLQFKKASNEVRGIRDTIETNIMAGLWRGVPEEEKQEYLIRLVQQFGGTRLGELARKKADKEGIVIPEKPATNPEVNSMVLDKEGTECCKTQKFVLSSTFKEEGVGLVRLDWKGSIRWLKNDPNGSRFELRLEKIRVETVDEKVRKKVGDLRPFTATISMSREDVVPFSIEITKGKADKKKYPSGLGQQYESAGLVSDMMLATAIKKEFVVSKRGKSTTLKISYPKKLRTDAFGVHDARLYGCSRAPVEFKVFPHMVGDGGTIGSDLLYFSHTELTTRYWYRLLDRATGMATRSVNLYGAMTEEKGKGEYIPLISIIDDPNKFSSYELHELIITDVK